MTPADDEEGRSRRRREREDEIEKEDAAKKKKMGIDVVPSSERLEELMERAIPMIEQVDALYGQYLRGTEKRPPVERRKILDQLMTTMSMMAKPNSTIQFRYITISGRYNTHRDKWERIIRDLESGKIQRGKGGSGG